MDASVKPAADIYITVFLLLEGVKVAVYVVPLPENELKFPPITPISPTANPVTLSLAVNVIVNVASLVVELFNTAFDPSVAVIVISGPVES